MALKQHPASQSIPVVIMSAGASQSEITSFYQTGAAAFMLKPVGIIAIQESLLVACQYAEKPG